MRAILYSPPANPLKSLSTAQSPPSPPTNWQRPWSILLTGACDLAFLLMASGVGLILHVLVIVVWPSTVDQLQRQVIEQMPFWAITTTAAGYLMIDGLRCRYARNQLPFNFSQRDIQRIYWQRLELIIGTAATHLLLLCLCLLMPGQPLFSKLFLSAIVALIAAAVGQSFPSRRAGFAASMGVFSGAMMMVTIAAMIQS
ncbi:MAG: hypothetical protein ACFBSG_13595 [Leptolyngbyaceae cyanobacterium]